MKSNTKFKRTLFKNQLKSFLPMHMMCAFNFCVATTLWKTNLRNYSHYL